MDVESLHLDVFFSVFFVLNVQSMADPLSVKMKHISSNLNSQYVQNKTIGYGISKELNFTN